MSTAAPTPQGDADEIRRTLRLLHPQGEVFEIRALGGKLRRPLSGYFDNQETPRGEALQCVRRGAEGVYVTLNPVNPALLARGKNRIAETQKVTATADKDVIRLHFVFIDVDPERPSGISSTDLEHRAALDKATEIAAWLARTGFPRPVIADSGNGAHLLYRLDLAPTESGLLRRVLATLDLVFSDAQVKVDTTTFNPGRICKLYGTPARKGDSTEQRAHRLARLVDVPQDLESVPEGRLKDIAEFMDSQSEPQTQHANRGGFDVRERLSRWGLEVLREESYKSGARLILRQCPFVEHRKAAKAAVFLDANGALGFHCFSDDCAGLKWRDLREKFEPRVLTASNENRAPARDRPFVEAAPFFQREPAWPSPPTADAFYGAAGAFVEMTRPYTEADPAALLLQFLVMFGCYVGPGPQRLVGKQVHHLNEYVVIVGPTKSGRKGTGYAEVEWFMRQVDRDWLDARKSGGLVSGEGLIWAVRDPIVKRVADKSNGKPTGEYSDVIEDPGIGDKRLPVIETEYSMTLKAAGRDGSTLSDVLRKAWDGSVLGTLAKVSPARATGAHICIIGHITPDELLRNLDSTEAANGFANRHLWCASRRTQELPWGGNEQDPRINDLIGRVRSAAEQARRVTEFKVDKPASDLWVHSYHELSTDRAGLLGAMVARSEAHVIRLAMLYAASDGSETIREAHLKAALAVWDYSERSAAFFFGERLGDPIADAIVEGLRNQPDGLTTTEIHGLFSRHVKASQIEAARGRLLQAGRIRIVREETKGAPSERWRLV